MWTLVWLPTGTCADAGETTIGGCVGAGLGVPAAGEAVAEGVGEDVGAGTCPRARSAVEPAAQTKTEAAATIAASGLRSIFRLRDFGYFAAYR